MMRRIAELFVLLCVTWIVVYPMAGGTTAGKDWYSRIGIALFSDGKGGTLMLALSVPLLVVATVCGIWAARNSFLSVANRRSALFIAKPANAFDRLFARVRGIGGDLSFNALGFAIIFIPCATFVVASLVRHFHGKTLGIDASVGAVGNTLGITALLAFSLFLVPVGRHSPVLKFLQWSQTQAIKLHIWAGRIIIVASLLHGAMHMYRWKAIAGENIWSILVPPRDCWAWNNADVSPQCHSPNTDCSCYDHFRNFFGGLAGLGLLVIALTTFSNVRRKCYKLFYMTHIVAGPLVFLAIVLHYSRAIFYIAPSLLIYTASSFPSLFESRRRMKEGGVKIVSVESISSAFSCSGDCRSRPCVAITMEASHVAVTDCQPGQYAKLHAPSVSAISHPFTINPVPGHSNQLRIIFRVMGPFTEELGSQLVASSNERDQPYPTIGVEGFYGSSLLLARIMQHDTAVMIAGGIGVTPYLSVLHALLQSATHAELSSHPEKRITLHWICRDDALVDYVRREYFDPLLLHATPCQIRIVIHRTAESMRNQQKTYSSIESTLTDAGNSEDMLSCMEMQQLPVAEEEQQSEGLPVEPSRFAFGSGRGWWGKLLPMFAFLAVVWIGLGLCWFSYMLMVRDAEEQVAIRASFLVSVVAIAWCVSAVASSSWLMRRGGCEPSHAELYLPDRKLYSQISGADSEFGQTTEESTTASDLSSVESGLQYPSPVPQVMHPIAVEELSSGRPEILGLLSGIDPEATCPCVFSCGPEALVADIRAKVSALSSQRKHQDIEGTSQVCLYEEIFEM